MSPRLRTRAQLARALLRAKSRAGVLALVRAAPRLVDDRVARRILAEFNRVVTQGRTPVAGARGVARAAEVVAAAIGSPVSRAVALRAAGVQAHLEGRSRAGARLLVRSAGLFAHAGCRGDAGDVERVLIDVHMIAGNYDAARRAARSAAECYAAAGRVGPRRLGGLAMNLGNLHHRLDQLQPALAEYTRAGRLFRRGGERRLAASAEYNRANVLASLDRTGAAREGYARAREAFVRERRPALVAQTDYALAGIDLLEGRLDECVAGLEDVKHRLADLGDPVGVAHAELDQAEALLRLNRPAEAGRLARSALATFSRRGYDGESAACLGALGGAELQQQRTARACAALERGRALELRRRNFTGAATLAIGLAAAQLRAGRAEQALRTATGAARALERKRLRSREARARAVGAQAALMAGRSALARRLAERALSLARGCNDLRVQFSVLLTLSRVDRTAGRRAAAYRRLLAAERCVERLRRGITAEESRLAFALDKGEVYEALIADRLERGDRRSIRQALRFAERGKARALAERLAARRREILGTGSGRALRLLARLDRVERDLAVAEVRVGEAAQRPGVRSTAAAVLGELTRSRLATLRGLDRESPALSALAGALPSDPLRALERLEEDELVLEYTAAEGHYHLFLCDRNSVEAFPRLAPVERVRDVADLLRFQLGKGVLGGQHLARFEAAVESSARGYLAQLHDLLLGPVSGRLDGRRLRVVPHGALHGLPFHAFERAGTALIERCVVSYTPSLAVMALIGGRARPHGGAPLVLGLADRAAPMIEAEVRAVRRHLPGARVLRGERATRGAVLAGGRGLPSLIHVACHGFYAEGSPWAGALRLGDAWLSLPEVYALPGTADVVVLSGCETGRGTVYSGDEWVGLVRGFLHAGARAVVGSLWEVHDRSAAALMDDFYAELAAGCPVAEALARAQRRARKRDSATLRWAPFMVIGNPRVRVTMQAAA